MAFVYMHIFSRLLRFDMSLLLLNVTLRGVSNKHCLLSLFSLHILKLRHRSAGGGTVQLQVEWVTGDPEPPPQFFNVLLCNLSSFCPIIS